MVAVIEGPPSRCPECLMDYLMGKKTCSGCGNNYEGWKTRDQGEKERVGTVPETGGFN